jgi:hypothetical protein
MILDIHTSISDELFLLENCHPVAVDSEMPAGDITRRNAWPRCLLVLFRPCSAPNARRTNPQSGEIP